MIIPFFFVISCFIFKNFPWKMLLELILFKESEEFYAQKYEKKGLVNLYCFCTGDQ